MDLIELREKVKGALKNFITQIGLDGESYDFLSDIFMEWGVAKAGFGIGEFISPGSKSLEEKIANLQYDEETKDKIRERGLIIIDEGFRDNEDNLELLNTAIHETIHANRNLMIFDVFARNEESDSEKGVNNEYAYYFDNDRIVQVSSERKFYNVDASQEILHGSIDSSRETINSYRESKLKDGNDEISSKMERQQYVDESLVELMAILSSALYRNKEKGITVDIWKMLEQIRDGEKEDNEDVSIMSEIILKHRDFELFYWMIDPISYSQGDIHYDFFEQYAKDDGDLVDKLVEASKKKIADTADSFIELINGKKISEEDVSEVATSTLAMNGLADIFATLRNFGLDLGDSGEHQK